MTIPDEIVREAIAAMGKGPMAETMRATLQVAVEWALEEAAKIADERDNINETTDSRLTARAIYYAIRARKDKP